MPVVERRELAGMGSLLGLVEEQAPEGDRAVASGRLPPRREVDRTLAVAV